MENKILNTLFVGIDVSSKENVLCALDFSGNKILKLKALNNQPGAESILDQILHCLDSNSLKRVVIALESTSFYSTHIANFLAANELLLAYEPLIYCLNPKAVANYRKSFIDMDKTDPLDAYIIADFARCGRITSAPWRVHQSGNFQSEQTRMTKTGNKYLRYYLIEAANSVKNHTPEYKEYYSKKFNEVNNHSHKRALALTSPKLIRLIFGLLTKNQLYSNDKVGEKK